MKKVLLLVVLTLLLSLSFSGASNAAHSYQFRYVGGGHEGAATLVITCLTTQEGITYTIGGACRTPCPEGSCDIVVTDDHNGNNVWFKIQIDNEHFFRPGVYKHQAHVTGNEVRIGVIIDDATTGWITLS